VSDEIEQRLREVTHESAEDLWRKAFDLWARGSTFDEAWQEAIAPRIISEAVQNSSNIRNYEYDPQVHILTIEFSGGSKYTYSDVAPEEWESRHDWDSQGKWVNETIKKGHPYERIE